MADSTTVERRFSSGPPCCRLYIPPLWDLHGAGSLNTSLGYGPINSFTWKFGEELDLAFDDEGVWLVLGVQRAQELVGAMEHL